MVEVDRDGLFRGCRRDLLDIADEAVVRYTFIIEGRQQERTGKPKLGRMPGQGDRIGERGGAGANHHAVERQSRVGIGAHDALSLGHRK